MQEKHLINTFLEWFFDSIKWEVFCVFILGFLWPFLQITWFSIFGKPREPFLYPRNWWRRGQLKIFSKLLNSIGRLIFSGRISFEHLDHTADGSNNHKTGIKVHKF